MNSIKELQKKFDLSNEKVQLLPFALDAGAVIRLYTRGIITETEYDIACRRLVEKIAEALNETN